MRNLLLVTSSLMAENSKSRQIAAEFVAQAKAVHQANVVERHLTPDNIPHLSLATLGALGTAPEQRDPAQTASVQFADHLIEEVEAADTVVIAAPMYNFSIPSTLKAWLDHLARAGRTFRYTANGPIGLLTGKKVYVVLSRGGYHKGSAMDFQEPYLRGFFGFVGITDIEFIYVEGQAVGPEAAAKGLAEARAALPLALAHAA